MHQRRENDFFARRAKELDPKTAEQSDTQSSNPTKLPSFGREKSAKANREANSISTCKSEIRNSKFEFHLQLGSNSSGELGFFASSCKVEPNGDSLRLASLFAFGRETNSAISVAC